MYAELIGNYQNYRIKSLQGNNEMMAELGDEELSGIPPKEENSKDNKLKLFGYWTDENGIKHKGVIPQKEAIVPKFNLWPTQYYDDSRYRTSDSRFNNEIIL